MHVSFPDYFKKKLIDPPHLERVCEKIRKEGQRLVSLNGSFDLLHAGHLYMLSEAKAQGDKLIVALNSDASIKRYKDPRRPIVTLRYRLQMLSAISFVDYVTWFEEDDPIRVLSFIKPDVHVNGSEYGQDCIEAKCIRDMGGRLHIVSLLEGLSTSKIIEKIKEVCV